MGQIIDFELTVESCLRFARSALEKENYLLALQNCNEAMSLAYTAKEIHAVLESYAKVFRLSENNRSFKSVLTMDIENRSISGYFRMDFSEFLTYNESYIENEQLRQMTLHQMERYNEIKNLFAERRYDEAISGLSDLVLNSEIAMGVVDCLKTAVENDDKFRLDNYVVTLLEVLAHSQSYYDMIKLMLEGGRLTHDIMVDSVDYFLSEADSVASLVILGETFFSSKEVDISKKFFEEALIQNPVEESSLYYMTVINLLLDKKEEAAKYWDTYKEAYRIIAPPIKLYERFFASKELTYLVPYGILPFDFSKKLVTELKKSCPKEDFDEEYSRKFVEFCMLSNDRHVFEMLSIKKLNNRPITVKTYLEILKNTKINDNIKRRIMMMLVDGGYEGKVTVVTETAIVIFDMIRLHHRVNEWWGVVYKALLRNLPFIDYYMPVKCSLMASLIKKFDAEVPNLEIEDLNFAIAIMIFNYIKRLKINVDIYDIARAMSVELDDLAKGLKKYDLKDLYI